MKVIFDLINHNESQSIIVTGESGAGKTLSSRRLLKFITYFFLKEKHHVYKEDNYNIFNNPYSNDNDNPKRNSRFFFTSPRHLTKKPFSN